MKNEEQFEFEENEMTLERYVKSKVADENKQEEIATIHDHGRKSEENLFLINLKPEKVEDSKVEVEVEDFKIEVDVEDLKFDMSEEDD